MLYAKTDRLVLRSLEENELPRFAKLLDVWDVVRWLTVVPYPYTLKDAESFYRDSVLNVDPQTPEVYIVAQPNDNLLIGAVGLHEPHSPHYAEGDLEIGYWLNPVFWGQGFMTEAARCALSLGFARASTDAIVATTEPNNKASQNVLQKIGLRAMGMVPRDYKTLRGSDTIVQWHLSRNEWEARRAS
ncbi:MAG: GNAT family N-acetyltransferase [Alphaproteobacteria bacterium]|nr:GNAT family N-acetyltransferase [Alphaproteobacteria bacterium]